MNQNLTEKIAVTWHPNIPKAEAVAEEIAGTLNLKGIPLPNIAKLNDPVFRRSLKKGEFDLVIALGGDGTMIRAGKLCAPGKIPVWGINMGSLGFLLETGPNDWREKLDSLIQGNYRIEKRMMLHAEIHPLNGKMQSHEVLNEVIVTRGTDIRPIHLSVRINGRNLAEYVADGLIAASATGSTAYAMAASGPILPPELRNILLLPVAPHLCFDRCLVLSEMDTVGIEVTSDVDTVFCPDGGNLTRLAKGDLVTVRASADSARFIRFEDEDAFYRKVTRNMQRNSAAGE